VTPPSPADQVARLASLAGEAPDWSRDTDVLAVAMIVAAKARGATWAQVGMALLGRPDGKLAKRRARQMARTAQRKVAGSLNLEAIDG